MAESSEIIIKQHRRGFSVGPLGAVVHWGGVKDRRGLYGALAGFVGIRGVGALKVTAQVEPGALHVELAPYGRRPRRP